MWLPKVYVSAHDTIWCQDQQICSPGWGRHCLPWPMLEAPPLLLMKHEASTLGILSKGNYLCMQPLVWCCSDLGCSTLPGDHREMLSTWDFSLTHPPGWAVEHNTQTWTIGWLKKRPLFCLMIPMTAFHRTWTGDEKADTETTVHHHITSQSHMATFSKPQSFHCLS